MEKFNENLKFSTIDSHSLSYKNFIIELKFHYKSRRNLGGEIILQNFSWKYGGSRPHDQHFRQRTPWTLVVLYAVCVRLSIGYQSYHCGYLYYTVVCIFAYHVLILYEFVYREKQRLCDFCNDHYDEWWRTQLTCTLYMSLLACIKMGGKMIHNFC